MDTNPRNPDMSDEFSECAQNQQYQIVIAFVQVTLYAIFLWLFFVNSSSPLLFRRLLYLLPRFVPQPLNWDVLSQNYGFFQVHLNFLKNLYQAIRRIRLLRHI